MTARAILPLAALATAGWSLVLSEIRWFRRPGLRRRLAPHGDPGASGLRRRPPGGVAQMVVTRWYESAVERIARGADLATRLERAGLEADAPAFRNRQLTEAGLALVAATTAALLAGLPAGATLAAALTLPAAVVLAREQQVADRNAAWRRRLDAELPVVAEQLGMLLSAGYSLGAAVDRLARRGHGICAEGFVRVGHRVRQGLSDHEALEEWAAGTARPSARRLARVLRLNAEASDLGDLIAMEARAARREAQRTLEAAIERRSQLVWVPVTVATLLPGVIFMAVPFVDAMSRLTG